MPAAPLPPDEAERLAALRRYDILDTPPEEGFDRITRLASHLLGAPMAVVSLLDQDRQWFKSRIGLEVAETPRGLAFCGHTILGDAPVLVGDATRDPRFADNPLVTRPPGIRSYAGAPLRTRCGHRIGTLCTVDITPRAFGPGDERALVDLAALASDQLELRRVARELRAELAERRQAEATIRELAYADALTGLPNRRRLNEALAELARPPAHGRAVAAALLLIDLDNFKDVNDSLGHDTGDALLQEVARRLRRAVREEDFVARLGGDEFAVVLRDMDRAAEAAGVARKLHEEVQRPFDHRGRRIEPGCTIGVGMFPRDGAEPSQLLKAADLALYHGKGSGRRAIGFFDSAMREALESRLAQTVELRRALGGDEFRLVYQPITRLEDGARTGFEALLRWRHPAKGLLAPAAFLDTAERSGLILPIGGIVLRLAIGQVGAWLDAGLEPGYMAVNVAAAQLKAEDFAAGVERQLAERRVEPERLVVELTENILLDDDAGRIVAALTRLHRAGVRIALDDFGTGFASLTHLKRFPIDLLKIDRSFVRDLGADANDGTIVRTIVNLAHSLGMRVVAEGVETEDQLAYLRLSGCDYAQGFLLGRPAEAGTVLPRSPRRARPPPPGRVPPPPPAVGAPRVDGRPSG